MFPGRDAMSIHGHVQMEEELQEFWALGAPEETPARRYEILRFQTWTAIEVDGYCRYLMSFGLGLLDRLLKMTAEQRRDYTLASFYRFSLSQRFPKFYQDDASLEESKDRSRMCYTAWLWDLARIAEVGRNYHIDVLQPFPGPEQ